MTLKDALLYLGALALCVAIAAGSMFAWKYVIQSGARSVAGSANSDSGRYRAFPFQSTDFVVIDTETGHCWQRSGFGEWRDLGAPSP